MSIVYVIIAALVALDLVWWLSADRLLRKAGFKRMRILHSLFFGVQLAGLLSVILSRRSELWDWLPKAMTAAVYLWHLLISAAAPSAPASRWNRCAGLLGDP